jgi:prepilin-type N-terminal cleavage/methylation domain-containing protein
VRRFHRNTAGYTFIELAVALLVLAIILALSIPNWIGRKNWETLRSATVQVYIDMREAQERAKAERTPYDVTFTVSSNAYTVARSTGGFSRTSRLPGVVRTPAALNLRFSAFGQPNTAVTISLQNDHGTGTVTINASGGIAYTLP